MGSRLLAQPPDRGFFADRRPYAYDGAGQHSLRRLRQNVLLRPYSPRETLERDLGPPPTPLRLMIHSRTSITFHRYLGTCTAGQERHKTMTDL